MSGKVYRRPQVAIDLVEHADYIARDNLEAAFRYLDAAEATFCDLAEQPSLGNRCFFENPRAANLLRWRVKGFENYQIFYQPMQDGVEIVRVIHAAQNIEAIFEAPSA